MTHRKFRVHPDAKASRRGKNRRGVLSKGTKTAVMMALVAGVLAVAPAAAAGGPILNIYTSGLTAGSGPNGITLGPDGAMWFTEFHNAKIGRIASDGTITEDPPSTSTQLTAGADPAGIVTGSDGNIYFSEFESGGNGAIGELDPNTGDLVNEYATPTSGSEPDGIAVGSDGAVWFAEQGTTTGVGRLDPTTHAITEYSVHVGTHLNYEPTSVVNGPDGALWITLLGTGQIARLDLSAASPGTDNGVTLYDLPSGSGSQPEGIAVGPDGDLYVAELGVDKVAQIDPTTVSPNTSNGITEFALDSAPLLVTSATDGGVWLTEPNANELVRFDPTTDTPTVVASGADGLSGQPTGIADDGSGHLWFTEFQVPAIGALAIGTHTLSVAVTGSGSGTVSSNGSPPISCPGTCTAQYPNGSSITLTEQTAAGSTFAGWSGGGCSGAGSTCQVTLGANTGVTATFNTAGPVPKNTAPPVVQGPSGTPPVPKAGQTVFCSRGVWTTHGTTIFTEAWFETQVRPPIKFPRTVQVATGPSFVIPDYPPGATINCAVTASDVNGSATAQSAAVTVLATKPALGFSLTVNGSAAPSINSAVGFGGTNTCTRGIWQHFPTRYRYGWYVVPMSNSGISPSEKVGSGPTLKIGGAEENGYLVCAVTAANAAGQTTALSNRYYIVEPDLGLEVNSMEITQGVQTPELPTRSAFNPAADRVSYHGVVLPWQTNNTPTTVELAEHHATVVRVYVDTKIPIGAHAVPPMTLEAFSNGQMLPPGPIESDSLPPASSLQVGALGAPPTTERYDPKGAYTFTLPWNWTQGDVTFEAQANPGVNAHPLTGCAACSTAREERTLILGPEHFNPTTDVFLDPIAFRITTPGAQEYPAGYPGIDPAWFKVAAVTPLPIHVPPYKAILDGTSWVNAGSITTTSCTLLVFCSSTTVTPSNSNAFSLAQSAGLLSEVESWADSNDTSSSRYPYGLVPTSKSFARGVSRALGSHILYGSDQPRSIATESRAVGGVAHELDHGLGLVHSDLTCGGNASPSTGQIGEPWAPNNDGAFDGVGLDTSVPSPYTIINTTAAVPVYDLMSYCNNNGGSFNVWMSVRNWNRDVEFHAPGPVHTVRGPAARSALATPSYATRLAANPGAVRSLAVTAVDEISTGTTIFAGVTPDAGAPTPAPAGAPYTLVGLDAQGHKVASAGAIASLEHIDHEPSELLIVGKIAAPGVHEIDILREGQPIARYRASLHAPTVKIPASLGGTRVGGSHGAVIRWSSHDADGGPLTATVRYSPDGGTTWHTIYEGPDQGRVVLASGLLSASRDAELRVYVSDGFNTTMATSARFKAVGAPPTVTISRPTARTTALAGAALQLVGSAYDDRGVALNGRALVWRAGRRVLGRGATVMTSSLPAGRYTVSLTARDHTGRTANATVKVRVLPAPPVLTALRGPRHLSPRARTVRLKVASLVPDRLSIGRTHATIGRRARSVTVHVRPGRATLTIIVVVRSGRYVVQAPIAIAR
jgi:virginiamycin B lyase